MKQIETTIEIERDDIGEVTIEADYIPGSPGERYDRNGDPGNPPEPWDVHRLRAYNELGLAVKLTDAEYEQACLAVHEEATR